MLFLHYQHSTGGEMTTPSVQAKTCFESPPAFKIPRPSNSWLLYRNFKVRELKDLDPTSRATQGAISKIVAELWRNESTEVRKYYEKQAEQCRADHNVKYPLYKLQLELRGKISRPRPKAPRKRPQSNKETSGDVSLPLSPSLSYSHPSSYSSSTTFTPALDVPIMEDFNWSSIYRTPSSTCWTPSEAPIYQAIYPSSVTLPESFEWCDPSSWDSSLLHLRLARLIHPHIPGGNKPLC